MELYDRIRQRRIELGLSQDELAKMLGYKSRSTIAKIESGENDITQSKIVAFAYALGVEPGYLMGYDDVPPPMPQLILSAEEEAHIKKYRQLDADGKMRINAMIDIELSVIDKKAGVTSERVS